MDPSIWLSSRSGFKINHHPTECKASSRSNNGTPPPWPNCERLHLPPTLATRLRRFYSFRARRIRLCPMNRRLSRFELFKKARIPCELITVQEGVHGVINREKDPKFQDLQERDDHLAI